MLVEATRLSALIIGPPERLRDSLRVLLRATTTIAGIEQADDGPSGLGKIACAPPALVVLDANLPNDEAWSVLSQLKSQWPQITCLVLAHHLDHERLARALGADTILPADFSTEAFLDTVHEFISAQ